jgi:hypothetical protein
MMKMFSVFAFWAKLANDNVNKMIRSFSFIG